jgi:DNA-binding XRE family transcriptional regulator
MPPPTDPERIEKARALNDSGMTQVQIAKEMGVHPVTICRWLRKADDPDPTVALDIAAHRADVRKKCITRGYGTVMKLFDEVDKDVKKGNFTARFPAVVQLGIMIDKVVALEGAQNRVPDLPQGSSVNIFAEIQNLAPVLEKVVNANRPQLVDGDVCADDTTEPVYTTGPQAPSEASGVPACYRPED